MKFASFHLSPQHHVDQTQILLLIKYILQNVQHTRNDFSCLYDWNGTGITRSAQLESIFKLSILGAKRFILRVFSAGFRLRAHLLISNRVAGSPLRSQCRIIKANEMTLSSPTLLQRDFITTYCVEEKIS